MDRIAERDARQYVVADANTEEILAWGFGSISDALDRCEELDPDCSFGVYARPATAEEMRWAA